MAQCLPCLGRGYIKHNEGQAFHIRVRAPWIRSEKRDAKIVIWDMLARFFDDVVGNIRLVGKHLIGLLVGRKLFQEQLEEAHVMMLFWSRQKSSCLGKRVLKMSEERLDLMLFMLEF